MRLGLRNRLLLTTTLVLCGGLGLTGWVLDRSFAASLETSAQEQLKLVIYGLIGVAEEAKGTLRVPTGRLEPRLAQPDSGLYARVWSARGTPVWESPSLALAAQPAVIAGNLPMDLQPGRFRFAADDGHFQAYYPVIWEDADEQVFILNAAVDRDPFHAETDQFRRTWMVGLAVVALVLVIVQVMAIALGLRPVALMSNRVKEVEAGKRQEMGSDYPPELNALARNLDVFIAHESASRDRYRRAMEDLAHSLKTPLAVLRNALASRTTPTEQSALLGEQLDRMETAVSYQLSRAIAARPSLHAPSVRVAPLCERLVRALDKAYRDKITCEWNIDAEASVRCDERDLMEMLGNLLENAFKYGSTRVRITTETSEDSMAVVCIEDDGPGIPPRLRQAVLARGVRADSRTDGHGIGLAVVVELAAAYGGRLTIGEGGLGGAAVRLHLPAR